MNAWTKIICTFLVLKCLASGAIPGVRTDSPTPIDKSAFTFFNPTPIDQLRELSVDGPGATESPYTVDAGHFQIEMSFVDYTSERDTFDGADFRFDGLVVAPMNLKVGLLNSLDLQILLEPYDHFYEREEFEGERTSVTRQGFGSTTVRLKYNLCGNDRGPVALALTPFVRFPTSQEGIGASIVEGGLIVPLAARFPGGWNLGLTTRFTSAQDILGGTGRHEEFGNSILLAHQLVGDLEGYVEYFSNVSTERDVGWVSRFDTGLIWWVADDWQLYTGMNVGLTKWADNWNFFVGYAWRY